MMAQHMAGRNPVVRPLLNLPPGERRADYCDVCLIEGGGKVYLLQLLVIEHQITLCLPCLHHLVTLAQAERRLFLLKKWKKGDQDHE